MKLPRISIKMARLAAFVTLAAALFSGCCSFPTHKPVAGKASYIGRMEGPEAGTDTGSIICTFGTLSHPRTNWWVNSKDIPKDPNAVHLVTTSLHEVVTGIPTGKAVLRFAASRPTKAPGRIRVNIKRSTTVIVSVDYLEDDRGLVMRRR